MKKLRLSLVEKLIVSETCGVHIWRSQLTNRGRAGINTPEPDSALAKLCAREGIELPDS